MFSKNLFALYILLLLLLTFMLARNPGHNGDMPFYIACAIEKDQGSMEGVIQKTDSILQESLPAKEYRSHAERLHQAPVALFEFYRIKPLYVLLVLAFHKMGVPYVLATTMPGLLAYFCIGLSIWGFTVKKWTPGKTLLISLLCMIIYPSLVLARLSTPDALSCFFMLNALLLLFQQRKPLLWFSLLLLAICARPDNLVAVCILILAAWKFPKPDNPYQIDAIGFAAFTGAAIGIALLLNAMSAHDFYWFVNPYFTQPAGRYSNDVGNYIVIFTGSFFLDTVVLFVFSGLIRGSFHYREPLNYWFYIMCLIVIVRFMLFPFYEERFFSPFVLFSILILFNHSTGVSAERAGNRVGRG